MHSSSKLNLKNPNQSVLGPSDSAKHNQSMIIHNTSIQGRTKDHNSSQLCFQFDELLKGLDRQVETQVNPLKKF